MRVKSSYAETLAFDDAGLASQLFGPLNAHLELISDASGADLQTRGTELTVSDPRPAQRELLLNLFTQGYGLLRSGHTLRGEDLLQGYEELLRNPHADISKMFREASVIVSPRKSIVARNTAQRQYMELLRRNELVFATGPAGTGKTYLAVAMAISMLAAKRVKKIVLTRPAVEAGEKLGFLPGEMKDKLDPYLQPLYDALQDMIPAAKLKEYMENNVIQIAPLAFMRGRTLNDAVIILDEAQNTTTHQIKMFLTRLGMNAKMIVTGDVTQIDLPPSTTSGLIQAMQILKGVNGIGKIEFTKKDIVRHKLVQRIVEAYDKFDDKRKKEIKEAKEKKTNIDNN